jgi:hypothetical protein
MGRLVGQAAFQPLEGVIAVVSRLVVPAQVMTGQGQQGFRGQGFRGTGVPGTPYLIIDGLLWAW